MASLRADQTVGVIGAGAVGAGIAQIAAAAGSAARLVRRTWAERIGIERVIAVLDDMAGLRGENRHRVSPLLRRKMSARGKFP